MGAYRDYLDYLNSIGLTGVCDYDYTNKKANRNNEIGRMLNRSIMMFQWHNLPETIPSEQLEKILQTQGYAIIGKIDDKLYACYGDLGGKLDEYYRPTQAIVSVPYFNFNATWYIGSECAVIKNDMTLQGLLPLYSKYAVFDTETDITLMLALINTRIQSHIVASDNRAIESAREYLNNVSEGKLGVIADTQMFENVKVYDTKDTDNLKRIQEIKQYLKGSFYNEIGLATNYNLKRERVSQAEVELNTDSLYPLIDNMYAMRLGGIKEVSELFGETWECEFNSSWDYRLYNGEPIITKGNNGGNINDISDSNDILIGGSDSDSDSVKGNVTDSVLSMGRGVQKIQDMDNDTDNMARSDTGDSGNDVCDMSGGIEQNNILETDIGESIANIVENANSILDDMTILNDPDNKNDED